MDKMKVMLAKEYEIGMIIKKDESKSLNLEIYFKKNSKLFDTVLVGDFT